MSQGAGGGRRNVPSGGEGRPAKTPRSEEIARGGLHNSRRLTTFGGALIGDVMSGEVDTRRAGTACRIANAMIRASEVEVRHNNGRPISFVEDDPSAGG